MKNLFIVLFLLIQLPLLAQQALFNPQEIISPEIHKDNSVTFRVFAPNAQKIELSGDWMPREGWNIIPKTMTKGKDSIWTLTSPPLPSELYSYNVIIDGVKTTDPNNVYLIRDVSSIFNVFIVGGGKADNYSVNNVAHGTVAKRWYDSPGNKMKRRMTVYTPAGYETSGKDYPVLYLLHGMGGDEEAWMDLGRASQIMDNLIAQGKAEPMIVVMTNGNVFQQAAPGQSDKGFYKPTMALPHTMDGQMEKTFGDVLDFINSNYRVKKGKDYTAIAGLSMGGFHTLHISRHYPNTFGYMGLFSAAVMPRSEQLPEFYQNLNESLTRQKENGYHLYWIAMGKTDFLYNEIKQYRATLDQLNMPYEYHESEGGHIWANWRDYLTLFVPKLFKAR